MTPESDPPASVAEADLPARIRALRRSGEESAALALAQRTATHPGARTLLREWLLGERRNEELLQLLDRSAARHPVSSRVDDAVRQQLLGDPQAAARLCREALAVDAHHAPAHNHLGRALFMAGDMAGARSSLARACELDPEYAEAWNNLGHVRRATGDMVGAREGFARATALTPAARTPRINLAIAEQALDDPGSALATLAPLLESSPEDIEAWRNAGLALHLLGRLEDAREHYVRALRADPVDPVTCYYAGALSAELGEVETARDLLRRALQRAPRDADAWSELAALEETQNRLDAAGDAVRAALGVDSAHPLARLIHARLLRRRGELHEAKVALERIDPARLTPRQAQHYHFELGTLLDRLGDSARAFASFTLGNTLAAASPRRRGIDPGAVFARIADYRHWAEAGAPAPDHRFEGDVGADLVFLIGFPRSGTTLLDTVLDDHPDIHSIEERPTLETAREVAQALLPAFPRGLETLDRGALARVRSVYRETLAALGAAGHDHLALDKLPMRTIEAGFAHVVFPQARYLFSLRHPCDVVLSGFMQEFAPNEAFIHFDSIADAARLYDATMQLWHVLRARLGERVHTVRYEELVRDPVATLARACRFLGVDFSPELIEHRGARLRDNVRTNSYHQVAEPLYTRAVARWHRYRRWLDPVRPLLQPHLDAFGYSWEDA